MTTIIGAGVSLEGVGLDGGATWNMHAGITSADEGKPMSVDAAANNTAKIAADGDGIVGMLFRVENRVAEGILVGTIIGEGGFRFNIKASDALAVGDTAVGDGAGAVRKLVATDNGTGAITLKHLFTNRVVEIDTTTTPHTAVLWFD